MGRTVMFGGSFNPPHEGHLAVVRRLLKEPIVEKVIICPAHVSPFKDRSDMSLSDDERLAGLDSLITTLNKDARDRVTISTLELDRKGPSYTVDTLHSLHKSHKDLAFAIGQDSFSTLHKWHKVDQIFQLAHCYVLPRGSAEFKSNRALETQLGSTISQKITFLKMPLIPLSSTDLRQ